jgi:hypothetical protein
MRRVRGSGVKHAGRVIGATDECHRDDLLGTSDRLGKSLSGIPSGRDFVYLEPMSGTSFIGSTEVSALFI